MESESINWEQDLPLDADEAYQSLVRSLRRTDGFSLLFVRCSPVQGDRIITDVRADLPSKTIEVLELKESIDNLYDHVAALPNREQINVLFIKGIEYSIFAYEDREMNDINLRSQSSVYGGTWQGIPRILGHLNFSRERFRDNFKFCFVFLLPEFALRYFIRRAPDFFDWRSNIYDFPTKKASFDREVFLTFYFDKSYPNYLELNPNQRIAELSSIKSLIDNPNMLIEQKAELLFKQGLIYAAAKEYDKAVASYKKAIVVIPDYLSYIATITFYCRVLQKLATTLLFELDRKEDAIKYYKELLKLQPKNHEALVNQGLALFNLDRYEEAKNSYEKALEIETCNHQVWNRYGNVLYELHKYEKAVDSYNKALYLKSDFYEALYNLGRALYKLGKNEEAIDSYKKALKIQPDYQNASKELYRVLWDTGKYNEATKISKLYPKGQFDVDNKLFKAYSLMNNGDYISAITPLFDLVENDLDNYKAFNLLGAALAKIGRQEEAIKYLDKSVQIKPDFYEAWINKGCVLQDSQKYVQSLESFDKAIEAEPNLYKGWYLRGVVLLQLDRWEEAINSLDKTLQLQSNFYIGWKERGAALLSLQRYLEAITSFDRSLQFYPEDHEVWYNRGIGLMNLNRYEEAIISFDKALQFQPSFLEIWSLKGQALEQLGRIKEANECYTKSGKYNPKSSQNQIANFVEESNTEKDISSYSNSSLDYPKGYIHPTVLKSKYDQLNNILKSPNQQSWLDWLRFIAF
jgi:tetratricopeptide (TPR) repeat protein